MKRNSKWIVAALLGVALTVFGAFPAMAYHQPTGKTIKAGMTDLPLRECQGMYAGILTKLAMGQSLNVWWLDGDGWAYVEVGGKMGWVCVANTY